MQIKREEIAARVRELRDCCDLSPAQMAEKLAITPAEYEKMETAQVDFPASLLHEIALLLKTDLMALLTGRSANMHAFCVTRSGAGVEVTRRADYGYQNLAAHFLNKKCEPFLVTVPPTNERPRANTHHGQEFAYLLAGKMKVFIHQQEIILEVGDSIYFDATQEHAMQALDNQPAKFLDVLV